MKGENSYLNKELFNPEEGFVVGLGLVEMLHEVPHVHILNESVRGGSLGGSGTGSRSKSLPLASEGGGSGCAMRRCRERRDSKN